MHKRIPLFFNIAGPCNPDDHYTLPSEARLQGVRELIDQRLYFVIHAPRQVGKTTAFRALAKELTAEGTYAALHLSCETGQAARSNVDAAIGALMANIHMSALDGLPEELRPPAEDKSTDPLARLMELLSRWARTCPRPLVLFFDEIDALLDDSLISVLRQLRSGYSLRPKSFPQSIVLIGLRDVRDYRIQSLIRPEEQSHGTASPFNIKVESIMLRNFNQEEVAELYQQHTTETSQLITPEAADRAYYLTQGQPWLVNALAREAIEKLVTDRSLPITVATIEQAKERLIERRDTHLDSLIDKLREDRVKRIIEPILAGDLLIGDSLWDDASYTEDLGLVRRIEGKQLDIANPIYREVIPRAMSYATQLTIPELDPQWYVADDGSLNLRGMIDHFLEFWGEHADALMKSQPYHEVAPHLILLAYLQRVVNGGGFIGREYAIGRGRMDICVRWPWAQGIQVEGIEIKVWKPKKPDPVEKGLEQLSGYLEKLGLDAGTLVIFDRRVETHEDACIQQEITEIEHKGRKIMVVRA